jgi:cob(I)alamin adenosyltransferase
MLYTKKGDDGKTSAYHCDQRFSKSSAIAEALGSLDEVNSFLGIIKSKTKDNNLQLIINNIQENLFIIQAEVAGADKIIGEEKIKEAEDLIAGIEKEIPPITSFIIPGVSIESAELDFARTLMRQAERRVVEVVEESYSVQAPLDKDLVKISSNTLAYLNRLSSLLYALARLSAHKSGINESAPNYK